MIHTITIGLSAFLLFLLQPMISRIILPDFGGGASVWLICLLFYQLLLLGGYSFSNLMARKLRPVKQGLVYTGVILLSLLFIPVQIRLQEAALTPVLHIFVILLFSIGLPYFLLSTTSPTVQFWMAADERNKKRNPYILYGVSNAGSLIGLLSYPTLIEPNLTNTQQTTFLSIGFCVYAFFILLCLILYVRRRPDAAKGPGAAPIEKMAPDAEPAQEKIPLRKKLNWMGLSMVPAAALMVFTNYLSVGVINFPLLWIIPLSIYLITFIICFLLPAVSKPSLIRTVIICLPILIMTMMFRWEYDIPVVLRIAAACLCLFAICTSFHGNLERAKPPARDLTSFYLYLSLGGCTGSALAGVVAPLIFKSTVEFYIVIVVSFYLILLPYFRLQKKSVRIFFRAAAAFVMIVSFMSEEFFYPGFITLKSRTFYSSYMVMEVPRLPGKSIAARVFRHGTTVHGGQARDRRKQLMPLFYFHRETGVGQAFSRLRDIKSIGVVGLGTGMVALYGKEGQTFDFYEIDREVVNIAENSFENLSSSQADIRHLVGDARLRIREIPDDYYDLLVLDAFASGSIPTHLITLEAVEEYLRVLREEGILMFNITNRYLDITPVLNCAAEKLGLHIRHHFSKQNLSTYRYPTHWVVLAGSEALLEKVTRGKPEWKTPPPDKICWSDEFSNLWSVIKF